MRKIFTLVLILLSIFFANAQEEPTAYVYPNEVYFPETQVGTAYETKVHIQLGSGFTDGYFYADLGGPVPCPFSYKYSWEDEFRPVDVGGWGYCCAYEGMSYELIIRFAPTEEGDFTGSLSLYAYTQNGEYVNIGYIPLSGSATQNPAAGVIPMSMDSITNIGMNAATANFTVNTAGLNSSYSYVNISDYSIVWGTSVNPAATSANTQIFYDQNGSVSSAGIENLTPGTTYYVRGTVDYNYTYTYQDPYYNWYQTTYDYYMTYYSNEVSFTTADTNAVTQPTVTTGAASSITATTATCGGEVTANGGATVTERGVCWSTSQNPTVDGSHQTVGIGIGSFAGSITGLTPTTTYYVRAYATNSEGTAYGEEVTFTTAAPYGQPCPGTPTVTDHEGNVYNTVQIGEQCWTRENLRTTTSPTTGTYLIPIVGTTYTYTGKQARWYNNDSATYAPMNYGLLYNWNAAADTFNTAYGETNVNTSYSNAVAVTFNGNRRGICPVGWHLPSEEEWTALKDYMRSQSEYVCGNSNFYIDKALADNAGWYYSSNDCAVGNDLSANNASGFSAVPAGKHIPSSPSFNSVGGSTYFWGSSQKSSSRAYSHVLYYSSGSIAGSNSAKCDGYSVRCLRNENTASTLATVTTGTVSDIAVTAATCGGNVTADGGATVTERGVCWSTSQTPTVADAHTSDGTGTGTFTSSITNLTSNTTYYVRAYATNSEGTAYGEEVSFTTEALNCVDEVELTPCTVGVAHTNTADYTDGTGGLETLKTGFSNEITHVADQDGNTYAVVQIGSQCWMAENLRTTRYADGSPASGLTMTRSSAYTSQVEYYYDYAGGDVANVPTYGMLYNWYAAVGGSVTDIATDQGVQGVCPKGWHVPSRNELGTMMINTGATYGAGKLAKGCEWTQWGSGSDYASPANYDYSERNSSGFGALPAGYFYLGTYNNFGTHALFMSSTLTQIYNENDAASCLYMGHQNVNLSISQMYLSEGLSVRCLRDEGAIAALPTVTTGAVSGITVSTATCGGNVTDDGGALVIARGVCWSITPNPTLADAHTSDGTGSDAFTSFMSGLTPNTIYYVRAYATNSEGTAYGEEVSFTTADIPTMFTCGTDKMTDADGNEYETVVIGTQCWTKSNMRTTHYVDGTSISLATPSGSHYIEEPPYYYDNTASDLVLEDRGYFYNLPAVMHSAGFSDANPSGVQGICSTGWHVPSDAEWGQLMQTTGNAPETQGFSLIKAGYLNSTQFSFEGQYAYFWTTSYGGEDYWGNSLGICRRFGAYGDYWSTYTPSPYYGLSVRCVKDDSTTASTLPTVTTSSVSNIAATAATCGGNVTSDGGATVTERGVCWSTSQSPTVADAHTSDGTGTGTFTSSITNLTSNTTYYVRAYATNSEGTAYGEEVTFTTAEESTPSTFTCGNNLIVGNYSYTTNQYGSQCWMTQNMRNASGSVGDTYYQDVLQACPTGWHLPDDSEWSSLGNYLINNENVPSFGDGEYWTSTTMLWEDNDGNQFTLISPPIVQSNNITYNGVSCEIHDYGHDCFALSTSPHIAYVRCLRNDNVIGSGDATNTYLPSYSYYKYSLTQQIYTAEEIGTAGTINSIAFKNASAEKTRTYNMYFLHTDKETFENNTDWVAMSSDNLVFSGELTFTVGEWTTITLDEPFVYDGSSNLLVGVADVTGSYTSSPHMACLVFDAPSQSIRVYRDSPGAYDIASPGVNGTIQNVKNQIKLGITPIEGSVCERPTSIAVSDITLNSATVSWTGEGSAFNLQYKISDDTDWTEVNGLSEFSYGLTGLAPFTTYRVRVQQVCAESASGWKTATFTTPACSPADQCELTFVLADGYGDGWNGCAINVVDAETGSIYGSCTIEGGSSATHQVTVCNGRNVNFVWVNGNYPDETSWVIYDVNDEEVTSSAGNSSMATGDVLETYTVSCAANPCRKPTNLLVSSTGITSVDLTWNENGSSTAWQLCLNGDTTNLVTADANPFTLTGLIPETTYTAKVRANCGDDGVSNWSPSVSFTTAPCPAPVTKDTAVCASELPLTWHGHTFEEFESFTDTLTTADGCDSIVTLRVRNLSYYNILLSDDFNDGVIDPEKWTYTGNAVVEEDGQLKLYQNVTDQDVHLRSVDLSVPANGKVTMDRKFRVHRSDNSTYGNYFYGNSRFYLNGGDNYVGLQYNYTTYEGWYGTYLIYNVNGNENRVRLCDATFDTWLTEQVEIDFFAGTLSYYLDTLVATMDIPGLSTQTVDYFNVFFNPGGWWTGHQHFLDYVDIHGGIGAVRTAPASDVTYTSATCGGEVAPNECDEYTATGVCYSTDHNPTLDDAHTTDGTGAGTFTSELTDLTEGTTYYVRAYAINSTDTVYGQEMNFTTCRHFFTEFEDAICENALPYIWNEVPYDEAGEYTQTFITAANCDSVVTLHLTVLSEPTVTITGPTTVDPGKSITLTASGADIYSWSANSAIIGNNDSITVSPEETTTYSVTGYMERRNLVVNSDFEQGNTGFTTNYSYVNDGSWGHYYIGHDNHEMWSWDPATNVITDHTTGNGLWMMVDAYPNRNIWSQTVEVTPNTDYAFSAWFVTNNIANARFEINGQQGEIFTTPQQQGVWEKRQFVWNSGNNTSANLKITTGSASSSGNDFGIDDISFAELICENTASTTVAICPLPVTLDTTVCPSELPLTWHNQTFEDYGTQTFTLQTATGCDSVVTLIVKTPFSLLSDDFNDGVIDPEKWTYTGNAVLEEDGILKIQQNVTDQDVHLRSINIDVPADGKVDMDRKFMVRRTNNYYTGSAQFFLNGDNNSYISLEYTYSQYYDGAYHYNDPKNGIYVNSKVGGTESSVRLCDATFDTWLTEHVELDFTAGTILYYLDTLVATVTIPGLASQTVDDFYVQFHGYGWWTGHQHYMDYVDIRGGMGAVRTSPVSDVAYTTATCGGEVASNECDAYTAVGVCWSTSLNPTLNDAHTTDGTGAGTFTSELTNLTEGTTYYVRAYATNSTDTVYGPTVSFTTCRHFTSEFEVTICENALPYIWNEVPYSGSGDYDQTFQTAAGCDSVVTLHLTVLPPPTVEIVRAAGSSATTCEGSSTTLEAVVTGGYGEITSYQWYKNGDMLPNETNTVLNIENLTPGADDLYTFEVAQTGDGCYNSASATLDTLVTVYPQFTVNVSGPASICDNGTLTLTATMENVSDDDELTYQWYKTSNGVSNAISGVNADTYTETGLQAGLYSYWVEVYGNISKCSAVSETSQVIILPTYSTTLYDTICQGFAYDFFGEPLAESGPYTHTLQAANGCDSVITLHLTVLPKPTVEIARVAGYAATVCEGTATAIEAVVTDGYGEIVSYQWYKNGDMLPNETNTVLNIENLTVGADDLYTFEVAQTGNGCSNTASVALNTLVTVYPQFTVSVSGPATICDNGTLTLTATVENASEDDVLIYQWHSLSGGIPEAISGANNIVYSTTDLQPGSYDYQIEVNSNVSGCNATSTPIHVDILPTFATALFDTICYGDDYEFFGDPLTQSGSYSHTLQAINGCDSVITLHLTVHPIPAVTHIYETICEKALPYIWNGIPYNESSDYTETYPNVNNCDSVVTLHLTVLPSLVGEPTTLTPIADDTVSNYPIRFTWKAVENASSYELYVWPVGESQPQEPTASHIQGTQYILSELPNYADYQWLIKAYNTCDTSMSTVQQFSLDVTPTLTVTCGNLVNFGEVPFNSTRNAYFQVNGSALEAPITYQLTGADASSFSLAPTNTWDDLNGGRMQLTFHPTIPQGEYTAQMTFQSGNLVETVTVIGALSNYYTFTTYVDSNIYAMDSEIPIYGQVTDPLNAPIPGVNVEVYVKVMDYVRILPATADANGQFTVTFTPQHSEAGYYTVGSRRAGSNSAAVHDDFNIPGMMLVSSDWILWNPTLDYADTGVIAVRNRSQIPLTNIQVTPQSLPNGCTVQFLPLDLAGMATGDLQYIVSGSQVSSGVNYEEVPLNAVSDEGATMDFSAWYYCIPQRADLDVMPTSLVSTMTRGKSKVVDFMIYNNGTGSTGNIIVSLPPVPWMSVVGGDTLPPLAAHDSAYVSIRLSADSATELVRYTGHFAIHCERGEGVNIPYDITAISDSTGTLVVDVTDEYAWNTNNGHGPHLAGANVTVRGYYSLETVATGVTDENGLFVANDLPEGWYKLIVRANRHAEYQNYLYITAGDTNLQEIFIPFQAITYSWDVVPTEIEDVYTYELNVDFETHVPKPVVTMDADRTLSLLEDCEMGQFNVLATNHGLVAAMDVSVVVPQSDYFVFTPLVSHLDSLPALTTYTIPVTYQRKDCAELGHLTNVPAAHTKAKAPDYYDGLPCEKDMFNLTYYYICQITHWETVISKELKYDAPLEGCEESPRPIVIGPQPTPGPGPDISNMTDIAINPDWVRNYPYINLPNLTGWTPGVTIDTTRTTPEVFKICDPNLTPCQNALNGILGCIPILSLSINSGSDSIYEPDYIHVNEGETMLNVGVETVKLLLKSYGVGFILDLVSYGEDAGCFAGLIHNMQNTITCIQSWTNPYTASEIKERDIRTILSILKFIFDPKLYWINYQAKPYIQNVILKKIQSASQTSNGPKKAVFYEGQITDSVRQEILAECLEIENSPEVEEMVNEYVDKWNHTIEAWGNGYFTAADAPEGYDTNFIQIDTNLFREFYELNEEAVSQGYANIFQRYNESVNALQNALEEYQENQSSASLCATVTVQFSQKMTMTREAFEGTLTINNGHEEKPIQDIDVDFVIRDENGVDCTNLFQINFLSYNNITGENGNASLGAQDEGSIIVQFIPTKQAAPEIAKVYSFGGTLSFIDPFTGEYMTNQLYPVDIWVHPSPDLYVNYFMQRDILGDDPLTEENVEPIVPAELGVIIHNRGAGTAKNVILETAEPRIIDNEKGLAVDFAMYGAAFNGNERQLGLMSIPFGNIEPNRTGVGEWWFTSTLLGHFVSYEAHVIHNNSFGNPDLSLVSSLRIHPLIHTVYAYGNLDDGINDFLVDDVDDYRNYPDSLYFSNGSRTSVATADSISFDHYVTPLDTIVQLTLDPSRIGWNYEQTWDPGRGQYKLISCTRNSDQQVIPLSNVWQSFVTIPVGADPIYENRLHIVDTLNTDQPTTYTLVFSLNDLVLAVDTIQNVPDSIITSPLSEVTVIFNKPIVDSTFNYSDISLKCNNGENLVDDNLNVERIDSVTYKLHLEPYTSQSGYYVLDIQTSEITDANGFNGYYTKRATWIQDINTCQTDSNSISLTVCDSYTWGSVPYTKSGTYTRTFFNIAGCDSVVTLHLTVNVSTEGDTTAVACDNFDWHGQHLTGSGDYTDVMTNAAGCDSTVTLHLTINVATEGDTSAVACDSFDWHGQHLTASGDYIDVMTNAAGCDSTVTLHLTINVATEGDTSAVACGSFDWHGQHLTASGDYTDVMTNAAGCDSTVTLHLTINVSTEGDTIAVACDNFDWHGQHLTASGDYTDVMTNAAGCDSTVTLHLTINVATEGDTIAVACDSYDWYENVGITESGEYTHVFTNANGCDSVVTLHLTLDPCPPDTVVVTIAGHNETVVYDGTEHNVSGYEVVSITINSVASTLYTSEDFSLVPGMLATANRTNVGQTDMGLTEASFVNNNMDYEIVNFHVTDGYMAIRPATLSITANSATKVYDGTPLTDDGFTVTSTLGSGDEVIAAVYGSQTCKGESANVINPTTVQVMHNNGDNTYTDVTDNYSPILLTDGILTVTPITTGFVCPDAVTFTLPEGVYEITITESDLNGPATLDPANEYTHVGNNFSTLNPMGVGTHIVVWTLYDDCDSVLTTCEQKVIVWNEACEGLTQYHGHYYEAVPIGSQCWLAENMRWATGNHHAFNDDDSNVEKFGYLYSWYTAMGVPENDDNAVPETQIGYDGEPYVQGICPDGWGVANEADFALLFATVGGTGAVKDMSTLYWLSGNEGTQPNVGFNARANGHFNSSTQRYEDLMTGSYFWMPESTTSGDIHNSAVIQYYCNDGLFRNHPKTDLQGVRCIRKVAP